MEALETIAGIAAMIDHSLLHPTLTDKELMEGCQLAATYQTASVCIKPYAVADAARWLAGTGVRTGTVIGFPHGNSAISVKMAETRQACLDGAVEIDMVVNIGKVLGEEWNYVKQEISTINQETTAHGAILKVIFENDYLKDEHKIKLCEICSEARVAFVKTSTGFAFLKSPEGQFITKGASLHDVALMRKHSAPWVMVKAAGGIRTLDDVIRHRSAGATRIGATATVSILTEARARWEGGEITHSQKGSSQDTGY